MTKKYDYAAALKALEAAAFIAGNNPPTHEQANIHRAAIRHALHTLQAITRALPAGVDPVRLVKGLAGEPSVQLQDAMRKQFYSHEKYVDFYEMAIAMRAQLYREASRPVPGLQSNPVSPDEVEG